MGKCLKCEAPITDMTLGHDCLDAVTKERDRYRKALEEIVKVTEDTGSVAAGVCARNIAKHTLGVK